MIHDRAISTALREGRPDRALNLAVATDALDHAKLAARRISEVGEEVHYALTHLPYDQGEALDKALLGVGMNLRRIQAAVDEATDLTHVIHANVVLANDKETASNELPDPDTQSVNDSQENE